jgi:hypothetical protein
MMPIFLTLRDDGGDELATAMLPPRDRRDSGLRTVIVGPQNSDPYPQHARAIGKLGEHFGVTLDRAQYFPNGRP